MSLSCLASCLESLDRRLQYLEAREGQTEYPGKTGTEKSHLEGMKLVETGVELLENRLAEVGPIKLQPSESDFDVRRFCSGEIQAYAQELSLILSGLNEPMFRKGVEDGLAQVASLANFRGYVRAFAEAVIEAAHRMAPWKSAETSAAIDFLIRKACHAWMDVQRGLDRDPSMVRDYNDLMKEHVKGTIRENLPGIRSQSDARMFANGEGFSLKLPDFFLGELKTPDSRLKARDLIQQWLVEVLNE